MDKLLDILYNNKENMKEIDYIDAMNSISEIHRNRQVYIIRHRNLILEIFGVLMIIILCFSFFHYIVIKLVV